MAKKIQTEQETKNENIEQNLQITIDELKQKNAELENEKSSLIQKINILESKQPKTIEKIVEKIVEIHKEVPTSSPIQSKFKVGDFVFFPKKYQRMRFEIRKVVGVSEDMALFRILNHETGIEEEYVREDNLELA